MRRTKGPAAESRGDAARPASDLAVTVIASIAIALPLMFYLHQHVEVLRYGYEIESLQARRAELVERARQLRVERLEAASLERVESQAAAAGLVRPGPGDVLVAAGGKARDGAPAAPIPENRPSLTARLETSRY